MESQKTRGGTRWKRFAVVMVPSVAATGTIAMAMAGGALAASFSVSGQQFKVSTTKLVGTGFLQYGAVEAQRDGKEVPVGVSAFRHAEITGLCQSVVVPVPGFGDMSMKLTAGNDPKNPVEADNLYIDLDQLNADAQFKNINIGVAAGDSTKGPGMNGGKEIADPGSFAQEADTAILTDVRQTAWATSAGTFRLSGLSMNVSKGDDECF